MAPTVAASWRRADGFNDISNGDIPAGQGSPDIPFSSPAPSVQPGPSPSSQSDSGVGTSLKTLGSSSSLSTLPTTSVLSSSSPAPSVKSSPPTSSVKPSSQPQPSSSTPPVVKSSSTPCPSSSVAHSPSSTPVSISSEKPLSTPVSFDKLLASPERDSSTVSQPFSSTLTPVSHQPSSTPQQNLVPSSIVSSVPVSISTNTGSSSSSSVVVSSSPAPSSIQQALDGDNAQSFVVITSTIQAVVPTAISSSSIIYTSSVTISTQSLVSTTSLAAAQDNVVSTKSDHKGAIIGGAVGGVALLIFLLALFCCMRKRSRARRLAEGSSMGEGGMPAPCCGPGAAGRGHGHGPASQMRQVAPSQVVPPRSDLLNRSPSSTGSIRSSRSSGSRRGKKPPPLQLESLVTPVINGPTNPTRKNPFADPTVPSLPTPDLGGNPFGDVGHQSRRPGFTVVEIPRSPARLL